MTTKQLSAALAIIILLILVFIAPSKAQITVNEYSVSNLNQFQDNYERYEDWIELHNTDINSINIGGYYLSDKIGNPTKWQFPPNTVIPGKGNLIIWASGRNEATAGHYHTNFRLSQTKPNPEYIVFSDYLGNILEIHQLELTQLGHSRGRIQDGAGNWGIFTNPTPGLSNNNATHYERYAQRPQMSLEAGFYPSAITIEITSDEPDAQTTYTLNGFQPTQGSTAYTGPISVPATRIIQARTFSSNPAVLPSLIEFNTYFINVSHDLVVLSVSANDMLNLLNGNANLRPHGSIEYFNADGVRTNAAYGEFNKHGQDSWVHAQRSIDYITRDEMGYSHSLQEQLFSLSDRTQFQRIIIRASGDDNYPGIDTSAHMRDIWVQNLAEKSGMSLDVRKGSRCILYANGQFWGVYSIREKVDDHDFTKYYYNQDKFDLQFIKFWGTVWAEYGGQKALDDWYAFRSYMLQSNVNNPDVFDSISRSYDYTSLVDYVIINSFVVCSDWLNWNVGWWRGLSPDGEGRKWKYILWDEDAVLGHYINYTGIPGQHPYVSPCFPDFLSGYSDPQQHIVILNKLRQNPVVNQYYITRYIDLINTAFLKNDLLEYVDSMSNLIAPDMEQHIARWGGTYGKWQSNVQKVRNFVELRADYYPTGVMNCYNLSGPYDFTVAVEPEGVGQIQLNSLLLENFPWSANYFGNIQTKLTAIVKNTNYEFDSWELSNHIPNPNQYAESISINLSNWEYVVARFKLRPYSDSLVINEINYKSASNFDSEDWVEFYNPHDYPLEITDWVFKDDNDNHSFVFPAGTILEPQGYLVLCRDTIKFKARYPHVSNYLGNMNFGFSSNGELLRLYNDALILIDTVHYQNSHPWPPEANGGGSTLELINPSLDNALAESWMASPLYGTPGEMNSLLASIPNQAVLYNITFTVTPNPVSHVAILRLETDKPVSDGNLKVYNTMGTEVMNIENIRTKHIRIERNQLSSGLYLFRFTDQKSKLAGTGKFVFQ